MRHTSFIGSLLPSEQMVAGLAIGGVGFLLEFGTLAFWTTLGLGTGLFFGGLAKFIRAGGLNGELARERALHHDL